MNPPPRVCILQAGIPHKRVIKKCPRSVPPFLYRLFDITEKPQILEAWEASQQEEQERKQGDSGVARTSLISSTPEGGPEAAPSSGTADEFEGHKQKQQGNHGARARDAGEAVPALALPKPNPFIPSEFAIKKTPETPAVAPPSPGVDKGEGGQHQQLLSKPCPRKMVRECAAGAAAAAAAAGVVMLTLWHLQDRTFKQPRAEIYVKVMGA